MNDEADEDSIVKLFADLARFGFRNSAVALWMQCFNKVEFDFGARDIDDHALSVKTDDHELCGLLDELRRLAPQSDQASAPLSSALCKIWAAMRRTAECPDEVEPGELRLPDWRRVICEVSRTRIQLRRSLFGNGANVLQALTDSDPVIEPLMTDVGLLAVVGIQCPVCGDDVLAYTKDDDAA
jgi:hypothetical protein